MTSTFDVQEKLDWYVSRTRFEPLRERSASLPATMSHCGPRQALRPGWSAGRSSTVEANEFFAVPVTVIRRRAALPPPLRPSRSVQSRPARGSGRHLTGAVSLTFRCKACRYPCGRRPPAAEPVLFEAIGQPLFLVQLSHPPGFGCHRSDPLRTMDATAHAAAGGTRVRPGARDIRR